jgi:hypothetical protein
MRSHEFHECDAPAKIESNDHPKIASSDLEPCALAVENFYIRSGKAHVVHRIPFGAFDQCPPTMKRDLRFGMSFGIGSQHSPRDNPHVEQYVPETGTLQVGQEKTAGK